MLAVDAPRSERHEMKALDAAGIRKLLNEARGDRYEALYVLAIHTGMRWGEIVGLQWQDVDLVSGVVQVRRVVREYYRPNARENEKWVVELAEPKSKSSRRSLRRRGRRSTRRAPQFAEPRSLKYRERQDKARNNGDHPNAGRRNDPHEYDYDTGRHPDPI